MKKEQKNELINLMDLCGISVRKLSNLTNLSYQKIYDYIYRNKAIKKIDYEKMLEIVKKHLI